MGLTSFPKRLYLDQEIIRRDATCAPPVMVLLCESQPRLCPGDERPPELEATASLPTLSHAPTPDVTTQHEESKRGMSNEDDRVVVRLTLHSLLVVSLMTFYKENVYAHYI